MPLNLSAARGLLFQIVHVRNLPWLLANGLPCANSPLKDPHFIPIGKADLIQDRAKRPVPSPPHGMSCAYLARSYPYGPPVAAMVRHTLSLPGPAGYVTDKATVVDAERLALCG